MSTTHRSWMVVLIVSLIALPTIGCLKSRETECLRLTTARVNTVTGPRTILVNQETDYVVSYSLENGCGSLEGVQSATSGNFVTVNLDAKYSGCVCTDMLLGGNITYKFKPTTAGTYYLVFPQPNLDPRIDTITVN